ncbi:MAG: hypothetical protein ABIA93_04355 [Candidatus Woesearchaeota archaeon]
MKRDFRWGIWFWAGAGVYSFINMLMNYGGIAQSKVLNYNYIIFAVAVIGFILNFILFKRGKKK